MKIQNLLLLVAYLVGKMSGILSRTDPEQDEEIVSAIGTVSSKEEDGNIFNVIGTVLNDPIGEVKNQLKSAFNIDLEGIELEIDDSTIKKFISYFVNPDNVRSLIQDVPLIDTEKLLVYIETGCKALLGLDDRKIDIQVPGIKYFQLGCESISSQERTETKRLVWKFQQFAQNISSDEDAFAEMRSLLSSDTDNINELLEDRHLDDPNYALFEFPRIACDLLSGVQLDQRKVDKYAPEINFIKSACEVLTKDDVELIAIRETEEVKSGCDIFCSSFWIIMFILVVRHL